MIEPVDTGSCVLDGQTLSASFAATLQDKPAALRAHSRTKTVNARSFLQFWLKSPFHSYTPAGLRSILSVSINDWMAIAWVSTNILPLKQ